MKVSKWKPGPIASAKYLRRTWLHRCPAGITVAVDGLGQLRGRRARPVSSSSVQYHGLGEQRNSH
ncbi:hypothetical protein [Streptomyces sp. NPDC001410]|uniref:hypothetical protein n=1 Tax=Streptomyces sp. NPDC001410 TaxID=3364574 RepID=UPI0036942D21